MATTRLQLQLGARRRGGSRPRGKSTTTKLTQAERDKLYKEKVAEFTKSGGSLSEIKTLNPELVKSYGPVTKLEYVVLANNEIRVTPGKAGHILLAGGEAVKSAGQLTLVKDGGGRVTMAVVTNGSGSYKPDVLSTHMILDKIHAATGVHPSRVVITKGECFSTQAVKIYMKGMGRTKEEIASAVKRIEDEANVKVAEAPKPSRGPVDCSPSVAKIVTVAPGP